MSISLIGKYGHFFTIRKCEEVAHSREQAVLQNLLRELRISAGLRQDEVAIRLETYQTFVSKYESGERSLDLPELRQVCAVFDCTLAEFVQRYEKALADEN